MGPLLTQSAGLRIGAFDDIAVFQASYHPALKQSLPFARFHRLIACLLTEADKLIVGISDESKYMLVAGAVAGGGLTVIANAPNPAGVALLKGGFDDEAIGAGGLLLGAIGPTAVAAAAFMFL